MDASMASYPLLVAAREAASRGDNERARELADEVERTFSKSAIPMEVVLVLRHYLDAMSRA
jgi:hypothetical protein